MFMMKQKLKVVVPLLFILVIAISQQVESVQNDRNILSQLISNKIYLQSVKNSIIQLLLHVTSREQNDATFSKQLNSEQVLSQGKAKGPNHNCPDLSKTDKLYRVTRPDESCQNGLIAKNPSGDSTILYHVRYGSKNVGTQFISTTTSKKLARTKYWPNVKPGGALVEIDIGRNVPGSCEIVNLNDADTREKELGSNPFAFNFARKDCEVLLDCGSKRVYCKTLKIKA